MEDSEEAAGRVRDVAAIAARLTEWIHAAKQVPEPPDRLEKILEQSEGIMSALEWTNDSFMAGNVAAVRRTLGEALSVLRKEVTRVKDRRRSKGHRLLGQAAIIEKALRSEELVDALEGDEAEVWATASEEGRQKARWRHYVLHELGQCEDTEAMVERAQELREEKGHRASRSSFYRWEKWLGEHGICGLLPLQDLPDSWDRSDP